MSELTAVQFRALAERVSAWAQCDEDRELAAALLVAGEQRELLDAARAELATRDAQALKDRDVQRRLNADLGALIRGR
jgi:hypothetical protein